MQQIIITGRIGSDAQTATTQSGDRVCNFSVAVDYRESREKATNWWRVSLWGKRAEALGPYLLKGVSITVSGEFSLGEYQGKPQLNVRANDIALQSSRNSGGEQKREPDGSQGSAQGGWGTGQPDMDDDIPFATNDSIY